MWPYTYRWQQESKAFLVRHPLCVDCECHDVVTVAMVVDHIKPHKNDMVLFWDQANWQGLCKQCHDRKTALEDGGFGRDGADRKPSKSCGVDGMPTDKKHHWNT